MSNIILWVIIRKHEEVFDKFFHTYGFYSNHPYCTVLVTLFPYVAHYLGTFLLGNLQLLKILALMNFIMIILLLNIKWGNQFLFCGNVSIAYVFLDFASDSKEFSMTFVLTKTLKNFNLFHIFYNSQGNMRNVLLEDISFSFTLPSQWCRCLQHWTLHLVLRLRVWWDVSTSLHRRAHRVTRIQI